MEAEAIADPPCLQVPQNALLMLVGASGSGKSWWAHRCFRDTEIVSSDRCRALVSDEETNQTVNREAFAVFYEIIRQRLSLGRLTVADSTALSAFARAGLRQIAQHQGVPIHVVVIHTPLEVLRQNNLRRLRRVPEQVMERQAARLADLVRERVLEHEGYDAIYHLPFTRLPYLSVQRVPASPSILEQPQP